MISKKSFLILSVVIFNAAWWLGVLYGNQSVPLLLILVVVHFVFSPNRTQDIKLLPFALVGIAMDATLVYAGVMTFNQAPIWLMLLWVHFVLALEYSFAWIGRLPLWAQLVSSVIGGAGGYIAGASLGTTTLPYGTVPTFILLSCLWVIILPAYFVIRRRMSGQEQLPWQKS